MRGGQCGGPFCLSWLEEDKRRIESRKKKEKRRHHQASRQGGERELSASYSVTPAFQKKKKEK